MIFKSISHSSKSDWFGNAKNGVGIDDQSICCMFNNEYVQSGLFADSFSGSFEFKGDGNYIFNTEVD